ncbi:MAG: Ribonuclease HII [Candidatus Bathyarchaeota archaeon BA1]|nr:MAG: Ribonuclease HII [Candidatus Bathyarchaeota archaeon BA1]
MERMQSILELKDSRCRSPQIEQVKLLRKRIQSEVTEYKKQAEKDYRKREAMKDLSNRLILGIDDAGRGAVIGPLVIAGVLLDEKDLHKLVNLGVRDSKLLSPRRREQLAEEIKKLALQCHVILLSPEEIDRVVESGRKLHKLNRLEAQTMAKVIAILKPDVAYVDASDVLADRFKHHIVESLPLKAQIISEHKADAKYPIVSAASIIAKVERDKAISKLRERHGDLGSGYAADPKTIQLLEDWIKRFGSYPDFVRESWEPAKRLKAKAKAKQTSLENI